jgi:hypothetical protein
MNMAGAATPLRVNSMQPGTRSSWRSRPEEGVAPLIARSRIAWIE